MSTNIPLSGRANDGFVETESGVKVWQRNSIQETTLNDPQKDDKTIIVPSPPINNASAVQPERPTWGRSIEFLMSCISMSVGLGNIWRFPFTAYENGGGAFLIPYIIVLVVIGKPMYYMEMVLGQFTSRSGVKVWSVSPFFRGVGFGQLFAGCTICSYYCVILAIALQYLFASFALELPWSQCQSEWGPNCVDSRPEVLANGTSQIQGQSSSELYFLNEVIKAKDDISDGIGLPDWRLALWELFAWAVVAAILVRGIKGSGKASYFLAIFPYVVLLVLLIRAVTLPGAIDGIMFFITPQFDKILSPKVWYAAATQMFLSLNCGMTTIIMFSSYNRFDHNIYRDATIVTIMDTFTSVLAGIATFAVLGNLAHNLGITDIRKVVNGGIGLAFVSYPDALAKIKFIPQFFSSLFFFMLFVLGLGSLVAVINAVATAIWDEFSKLKYWQIILPISGVGFLCSLIYITPGGQWLLSLVDFYGGTFVIFVLSIFELIGVFWIYGLENFCNDLEFMLNRRPSFYWKICWGFVTPVSLIVIFVYSMVTTAPLKYNGKDYPDGYIVAGWIIFFTGLILVPLWATYIIGLRKPLENLKKSLKPKDSWGPKVPENYQKWISYRAKKQEEKKNVMEYHNWSEFKYKIMFLFNKHT